MNLQENIRRILREETSNRMQNKLIDMIKTLGIDKTSKVVGGVDNLLQVLNIRRPMDFLHLFDDLDVVKSKQRTDWFLFRYKPNHNFMIYNTKNKNVFINYEEIWNILQSYFGLNGLQIERLTKEWLGEVYKLRGVTPNTGERGKYFLMLDEVYNLKSNERKN